MKILVSMLLTLLLSACANQALKHNYAGDIEIQTLQVELAPIRDPEQSLNEDFSKITKVLKGVQEVWELLDPKQSDVLVNQLHTFESTLVEGIRTKAKLPLVSPTDSEVSMQYGDNYELTNIEYEYPVREGAYLNVFATIYYTERSDLAIGSDIYNANLIELRPEIILQIDGYNEKGDLFWRQTTHHESDEMFKFGDQYVLGVPLDHLDEGQIFLVPLAELAIKNLTIEKE